MAGSGLVDLVRPLRLVVVNGRRDVGALVVFDVVEAVVDGPVDQLVKPEKNNQNLMLS